MTTYRGFRNRCEYNRARGIRLSQWRRKKLARLSEAQNHRCAYCQQDTFLGEVLPENMSWNQRATLEHFVPQSENVQTNKDQNLIMACDECNATRGSSDAFIFYRTIHDEEFRNNRNNELMQLTKREIRRSKSLRRKTRKIEIRNEAEGEKFQRLIEKEERTRALAYTLVTYYPSELIEEMIANFAPRPAIRVGRPGQIEKIVQRLSHKFYYPMSYIGKNFTSIVH